MSDVYSRTAERLEGYYNFDPTVIDAVAEAAAVQAQFETYHDFLVSVGAATTFMFQHDGNSFEMVDIRPEHHDESKAKIVRLGMGNPLDMNSLFQIGKIASLNPNTRIIATGLLSGGDYPGGELNADQNAEVRNGDFTALSEPARAYGELTGVEVFDEEGFSAGAHIAMAGVKNHDINELTVIEAVMGKRGLLRLGKDFTMTSFALDKYVNSSESPIFNAARDDSIQQGPYLAGLVKPTNRATARGLSKLSATTGDVMTDIVANNRVNRLTNVWASDSELGDDLASAKLVNSLVQLATDCDVQGIRVAGARHLMVNDTDLFGALDLQAQIKRK